MASNSRSIFVEEDESDSSINTNTTVASERQDEYNVEKVLAEQLFEGEILYLVKWEGYPIHDCSWEPAENFLNDDSLQEWEEHKKQIGLGLTKAFDVKKYDDAKAKHDRQCLKRAEKREQKRNLQRKEGRRLVAAKDRKNGTARKVIHDSDESSDSTRKRKPTSPQVGLTVNGYRKRRRLSTDSLPSSPAASVNDVANSQFSLFNDTEAASTERRASFSPETVKSKPTNKRRASVTSPASPATTKSGPIKKKLQKDPLSKAADAPKKPQSLSTSSERRDRVSSTKTLSKVDTTSKARPHATGSPVNHQLPILARATTTPDLSQVVARVDKARRASETNTELPSTATVSKGPPNPSAPPHQPAPKPTSAPRKNAVKLFLDSTAKARQRPRVSEFTPKNSPNAQFVNLSTTRRFQNYSRNEPAPDVNALRFVDPSTGKVLPTEASKSASRVATGANATQLDSRAANTGESRSGSAATNANPWSPQQASAGAGDPRSIQASKNRFAYPSALETNPLPPTKSITCRFWLKTKNCSFGDRCIWAHHYTGIFQPKKQATCSYWEKGKCTWSDEECEYVHGYLLTAEPTRARSSSPMTGVRQDEVPHRSGTTLPPNAPQYLEQVSTTSSTLDLPKRNERSDKRIGERGDEPIDERNGGQGDDPMNKQSDEPQGSYTNETWTSLSTAVDEAPAGQDAPTIEGCLYIGSSDAGLDHAVGVKLEFDISASPARFLEIVGQTPTFQCTEMCRSRDFELYWFDIEESWASGNVLCNSEDVSLEDFLVLHSAGAVVRNENYVMVIHPTKMPDWQFLPNRGPQQSGFRFYVQATISDSLDSILPRSNDVKDTKTSFVMMAKKYLDLDYNTIFTGNNNKQLEKLVYLCFPRGAPETKLLENYLSEFGVQMFYSDSHKLWSQFCGHGKNPNRILLFHPSMSEYWKIPEFHNVLATSTHIFQLGVDKSITTRPEAATKYTCVRLFPTGSMTLVTDDIFRYHPAQAVKVLQSFDQAVKSKPEGGRNDRMYTRPGLLAWLAQLIDEDSEAGKLTVDSPRIKVWQIACNLMNLKAADTSVNALRSDTSAPPVLYSPPKREMPEYEPLWDGSEEDATDHLVQWFSGLCICEREHYRRFTVLYEQHEKIAAHTPGLREFTNPKDPRGWMERYRHVQVTTPNRWVAAREEYERQKMKPRS